MKVPRPFSRRELAKLPPSLALAEDLTGSFFKIPVFDRRKYPFEVDTLRNLEPAEIADEAFAQVCRYEAPNLSIPGRGLRRSFYRICLQDHNIRRAVPPEEEPQAFEALLLYILTHELCHVVRFCNFQQLFEADEHQRASEEQLVHRLTRQILARHRSRHLEQVIERYADDPRL